MNPRKNKVKTFVFKITLFSIEHKSINSVCADFNGGLEKNDYTHKILNAHEHILNAHEFSNYLSDPDIKHNLSKPQCTLLVNIRKHNHTNISREASGVRKLEDYNHISAFSNL